MFSDSFLLPWAVDSPSGGRWHSLSFTAYRTGCMVWVAAQNQHSIGAVVGLTHWLGLNALCRAWCLWSDVKAGREEQRGRKVEDC